MNVSTNVLKRTGLVLAAVLLLGLWIFTADRSFAAGNSDIKVTLKWSPVYEKSYYNFAGKCKIHFSASWDSQEQLNSYTKQGWKFTYSIVDKNDQRVKASFDIAKGANYKVPSSKAGNSYKLKVTGKKAGAKTITAESPLTAKFQFPYRVNSLTATSDESGNDVKLKWKKVSNAAGYYIYRSSKSKTVVLKPIAKVEGKNVVKYTDENLPGKTYRYWVRAYYKQGAEGEQCEVLSKQSKSAKVKVKRYVTEKVCTLTQWTANIRHKVTLYSNVSGGEKTGVLKKGTKVYVTSKYPSKVPAYKMPTKVYVIQKKNGKAVKKGWVPWSAVKTVYGVVSYDNKTNTPLDWPTKVKEDYINKKGFSSKTNYLIWVSIFTQRVNIFKGKKGDWEYVRSFRVTTGRYDHPTKVSTTFETHGHQMTRERFSPNSQQYYYFNYLTFFHSKNAFHTVCYRSGTGKQINSVKSNLQPGTSGCFRMPTDGAKYIYYNLPLHTRVIAY